MTSEKEKKEILQHIFHLEEKQVHHYESPDDLMVDFQEVFDMIQKYKQTYNDAIGEMDLLMKLFPAILRPNLDRLTSQSATETHKFIRYVISHLDTTGRLLNALFKEVQAEYKVAIREIGDLIKTLDPKRSITKEINADLDTFLKA